MHSQYASVVVGSARDYLGPYPVDMRAMVRCSGANSEIYVAPSLPLAGVAEFLQRSLTIGATGEIFVPAGHYLRAVPAGVGRLNIWVIGI